MAIRKNPFQPLLDPIPAPMRNKYALVAVLFFVWMLFFDKHDVFTQFSLNSTINKLEADKTFYTKKIKEAKLDRLNLSKNMEKFARERYYMSKSNEDVFVIQTEK